MKILNKIIITSIASTILTTFLILIITTLAEDKETTTIKNKDNPTSKVIVTLIITISATITTQITQHQRHEDQTRKQNQTKNKEIKISELLKKLEKLDKIDEEISKCWSITKDIEPNTPSEIAITLITPLIRDIESITSRNSSPFKDHEEIHTSINQIGQDLRNLKAILKNRKTAHQNTINEYIEQYQQTIATSYSKYHNEIENNKDKIKQEITLKTETLHS